MAKIDQSDLSRFTETGMYRFARGLFLQVKSAGAKSWVYRYTLNGKPRWMGLGSAHDLTVAEAKRRRDIERGRVRDGVDVVGERKATRAQMQQQVQLTFRQAATDYIADRKSTWSNAKHAAQWSSTLEAYVYPMIGDLPVGEIDTPLVLKILSPIWKEKPETASRVRSRIEAILSWATVHGHRAGDNPARWQGHLKEALVAKPAPKHHARLPYDQVPAFMATLKGKQAVAYRALEFAILTASRTGPILEARWDQLDLDAGIWTIPAELMKARRDHRVPLAHRAREIAREMDRGSEFLFAGGSRSQLSTSAMDAALNRLGNYRDIDGRAVTVHGFRSTFKDWVRERTGFPDDLSEAALAHMIGDKTIEAYARGDLFDKRRVLMEAWANCCAGMPTDNVRALWTHAA